jgi:16S rRNA (cytidine1402-2'-O)-methyltransferase
LTGTLYVVGTPIGNLGDITLRAVETLKSVERVAAEDTRRTRALLSHLGISGKPLEALDAHAAPQKLERLLDRIERGESVALVTDAGMPAVSDPGAELVARAVARGIDVRVVPGPSAATAAVALSGLVNGPFWFFGFLPRRAGKRREALARIAATAEPVVLFEAPGRVGKTLADLAELAPERSAAVCRELTKLHEEARRGMLDELARGDDAWRGEVTIVLGALAPTNEPVDDDAVEQRIADQLSAGRSPKQAAAELASWSGRPRRELYARAVAQRARRER